MQFGRKLAVHVSSAAEATAAATAAAAAAGSGGSVGAGAVRGEDGGGVEGVCDVRLYLSMERKKVARFAVYM